MVCTDTVCFGLIVTLYVETTASVLSATLGYLSIYQEEQDKAYREIMDHISRTGSVVGFLYHYER